LTPLASLRPLLAGAQKAGLATAAAVALLAPASAHAAKNMEVALADDPVFLAQSYYDRGQALQNARQLGVTRLRVVVTWAAVLGKQGASTEPPAQPTYYWGWYEQLIDAAAAAGIRIQLVLAPPAPAFATGNKQIGSTRPDAKQFGDFARAVATRFKGRVDRYSIWNEGNHDGWLRPSPEAPALYRALYLSAYTAIKSADKRAAVWFGETSPYRGSRAMAPLNFLRRVACVTPAYTTDRKCLDAQRPEFRGPLVTDGYAHHPYEFTKPPSTDYRGNDNVTIGTLPRLTAALDRLKKARALVPRRGRSVPVYLTEFGYFASGKRATPEKLRSKYLPKAFAIAQKNARVRQMLHYGLVAPPSNQSGSAFDFGLLLADGSQRQAYGPLTAWAAKAMSKRQVVAPGPAIALPPAQPGADPPGEPPPEPCTLVLGLPCP
jgi:hypothetical protein